MSITPGCEGSIEGGETWGRYSFLGFDPIMRVTSPETLPNELLITAQDNMGEIMAVQHRRFPIYGLQFHPESIMTPDGMTILKNFLEVKCQLQV